jgi:hypothetical protein
MKSHQAGTKGCWPDATGAMSRGTAEAIDAVVVAAGVAPAAGLWRLGFGDRQRAIEARPQRANCPRNDDLEGVVAYAFDRVATPQAGRPALRMSGSLSASHTRARRRDGLCAGDFHVDVLSARASSSARTC